MPDFCDHASKYTEVLVDTYLRYRKRPGPKATGKCLNCEEPLPHERRWCDAGCRDMWLREWRNLIPRDVPPAEREEVVVFSETKIVDGE